MPRMIRTPTGRLVLAARQAMTRRLPAGLFLLAAALSTLVPLAAVQAEFANPHGVAVVIGNRAYTDERVPEVVYAHRDAEAFERYVLDVLGFDPGNVIVLRDATQGEMESAFGNERSHQGKVWRYLHPRHGSDVVVFYSGHGVPGLEDRRGYLLPTDADPDSAEINGYPLDVLYENLGKLEAAKSVQVFLDACFSGDSDRGMLVRSASPVYVQASLPEASGDKLTVLAAASGKEVASWDEEAGHGLFTHHLLDALYGGGDGDGDGRVTALEAKEYLDDTMTLAARRAFGRHQTASLNGVSGAVLASAGAGGVFPGRPVLDGGGSAPEWVVEEREERRWVLEASGVHSGPGEGHEELGRLGRGAQVQVTGRVESGGETWLRIARAEGGAGYVRASRLSTEPPRRSGEAVEAELGLGRGERALIQRGLAGLGFSPGPVDGAFGPKTRQAVEEWQSAKGWEAKGYLTREQADVLLALGREAQADEAHRVQEEREEEERLAEEAERRADDAAYGRAESAGTAAAYERYVRENPRGRHVAQAKRRIEAMKTPAVGERFRDCAQCPEMVVVPSGSFAMGSPSSEAERPYVGGPVHRVRIGESFAVGVHEVTRGQWRRFVEETGHSSGNSCWTYEGGGWAERSGRSWRNPGFSQGEEHPVVCVSWEDARAYVEWLSRKTGEGYRLLSESEWEYVARGGTKTARYWGESETGQCGYANGAGLEAKKHYSNWPWAVVSCNDGYVHTSPVGSYKKNPYGLRDVLGNVWEWVEDCWNGSYRGAPADGSAWESGDCSMRMMRGGSWTFSPRVLRSAVRGGVVTGSRGDGLGFRVARTLIP